VYSKYPHIPTRWHEFELPRYWREAAYQIKGNNLRNVHKGVKSTRLNGSTVENPIPLQPKGYVNQVNVEMG
jgi:cellobiose phosphorylase